MNWEGPQNLVNKRTKECQQLIKKYTEEASPVPGDSWTLL